MILKKIVNIMASSCLLILCPGLLVDKELYEQVAALDVETCEIQQIFGPEEHRRATHSMSKFYGYYDSRSDLPEVLTDGYAYIKHDEGFLVYYVKDGHWSNQGFNVYEDWSIVTPQMYGAKGDGIQDDAPAIRAMIEDLPSSNFCIYFPPGIYLQGNGMNAIPCYFPISNKRDFCIVGYDVEIIANKTNSCVQDNAGFYFSNCQRGLVQGITYNGSIADRKPSMGDAGSINKQSAFMVENCSYIVFRDCTATGAVMDGFSFFASYAMENSDIVSHPSSFCIMDNCVAEYCYRGGISGIRADFCTIRNCQSNYNGTIYGTSPYFGIDLEDGYYEGQDGWVIERCVFKDNKGTSISLSAGTHNTIVQDCRTIGNSLSIQHTDNGVGESINNVIKNCVLGNAVVSYVPGLSLYDNLIECSTNRPDVIYLDNINGRNGHIIDTIKRNTIRCLWEAAEQTYRGGLVSLKRGVSFKRPLVVDYNVFENLTGYNPFFFRGAPLISFCFNKLICATDISQYGTRAASFSGEAMAALRKNHNTYDQYYGVKINNQFDYLNDNRDEFVIQPYVYNVKGSDVVYDVTLGDKSCLAPITYVRINHDAITQVRMIIESGVMRNNGYVVESGSPSNSFSYAYNVDENNIAHLLITSSSGGYYYPTIELFSKNGKMSSILSSQMSCVRRKKTLEDSALFWFTPSA